jgi:hypothetical protein
MQLKGKVISGWLGGDLHPNNAVPQNSSKAKKEMPVSRRKEIGLPLMMAVTLGSHGVITTRLRSPGPLQSSAAGPRRLVREEERWGGLDPPL